MKDGIGQMKSPRELREMSDEWFINNLIGLAKAELELVKAGKRESVNRHSLARWAFNNANIPLDKSVAV